MPSIGRRIRRTYLWISTCIIGVMVSSVLLINEDLEQTMLELDFSEERDFFFRHYDFSEPFNWQSSTLTVLFQPDGLANPPSLPPVFAGLPNPFSQEVVHEGRTYLVNIGKTDGGNFYIAKDITLFEEREALFNVVLAMASLGILGLSFLLSVMGSRRVIKPLQQLSDHIRATPMGQRMPRLMLKYQDAELAAIADTFNQFLDELEIFVKREQSLVNLASHELRTPISVITGALDVLEQRRQLPANDRATLMRIRKAVQEMEENVSVLLQLSRRAKVRDSRQNVCIPDILEEIMDDLTLGFNVEQRVKLELAGTETQFTDPVLAKMLIRNLIQNALQHTSRNVHVQLQPGQLKISDEGNGLTPAQREILTQDHARETDIASLSGLGLYIATKVCERLGWRVQVDDCTSRGTVIRLLFMA